MDSVEERICAVATAKKNMADLCVTGGFFDGSSDSSTADQRRQYLLDVLAQGSASAPGSETVTSLSDEQVNGLKLSLILPNIVIKPFNRRD